MAGQRWFGDRLNRIENVTTDSGDDFVRGNGGANILSGQDGSDRLFGHGGNDILIGGLGTIFCLVVAVLILTTSIW